MSPGPGGVTASCCICGDPIAHDDPDTDALCPSCFTLNLAGTQVCLHPPVVRPALGLSGREHPALRVYQRHVAQVEGTGPCTPLVREEGEA